MCGQLIVAPRAILSHTSAATPWRRYENKAFFRSSVLSDQLAAAARRPKIATMIMWTRVVFPPPALARGYKEGRPLRQQRPLKQGERQQYRDAFADGIQRDVDKPLSRRNLEPL